MIQEAARKVQDEKDRQEAEAEAERQRQLAAQRQAEGAQAQQSGGNTSSGNTSGGKTGTTGSSNTSSGGSSSSEPSYSPVTGNAIVDRAYSKIGCWYQWGAVGPNTFDCSGLVSYALTGSYVRLGNTTTFMGWTRVSNP